MSQNYSHLRCPKCVRIHDGHLKKIDSKLVCTESTCGQEYPIHEGLPILLTPSQDQFHYLDQVGVKNARN